MTKEFISLNIFIGFQKKQCVGNISIKKKEINGKFSLSLLSLLELCIYDGLKAALGEVKLLLK